MERVRAESEISARNLWEVSRDRCDGDRFSVVEQSAI